MLVKQLNNDKKKKINSLPDLICIDRNMHLSLLWLNKMYDNERKRELPNHTIKFALV
jgi:hypothetical protein